MRKTCRVVSMLCLVPVVFACLFCSEADARTQLNLTSRTELRPVNWPGHQKLWFAAGPYWIDEFEQGVQSGTLDQTASLRVWNTNRTVDFGRGFIRFERAGDVKEGSLAHDTPLCVVNTASPNKIVVTFMGARTVEFGYDGCVMKGTLAQGASLRTYEGRTGDYPRGTVVDFYGSGQVTRVVLPAGSSMTGVDGVYFGSCSIPGIGIFDIRFAARSGVFEGVTELQHLSLRYAGNHDAAGAISNGIVTGWVDDWNAAKRACIRWTLRGPMTGTLRASRVAATDPNGLTRTGVCGAAPANNAQAQAALKGNIVACPSDSTAPPPPPPPQPPPPPAGSGGVTAESHWSVNSHPVPWVFHADGTVEAPGLWKGSWQRTGDTYEIALEMQGVRDSFSLKFAPDGKTFTAYKNGEIYRRGVRK